MVLGVDGPQILRFCGTRDDALNLGEGHELVVRRVDRRQRHGRDAGRDGRRTEARLVGGLLGEVDDRIAPAPAQLVDVGQAEPDDARDRLLDVRLGRGKLSRPSLFSHLHPSLDYR